MRVHPAKRRRHATSTVGVGVVLGYPRALWGRRLRSYSPLPRRRHLGYYKRRGWVRSGLRRLGLLRNGRVTDGSEWRRGSSVGGDQQVRRLVGTAAGGPAGDRSLWCQWRQRTVGARLRASSRQAEEGRRHCRQEAEGTLEAAGGESPLAGCRLVHVQDGGWMIRSKLTRPSKFQKIGSLSLNPYRL